MLQIYIKRRSSGSCCLSRFLQVRDSLYIDTLNMLMGRIDLAERAYANYSQLYDAYNNGTPIFRYKFRTELRADNLLMTPKPLLKESLVRTSYARKYSSRVGKDIMQIKDWLTTYSELANISYTNRSIDEHDMYIANIMFLNRGRRYYHSRSVFYVESIEYPQRFMEDRLEELDRDWRILEADLNNVISDVVTLLESLNMLEGSILARLENIIEVAQIYIDHGVYGNITKIKVGDKFSCVLWYIFHFKLERVTLSPRNLKF